MSPSAPCYSCATNMADATGAAQLKRINKIISDNFTVIVLCFFAICLLIFMIWFFGRSLHTVVKNWYDVRTKLDNTNNANNATILNDDTEVYDDEDEMLTNIMITDPNKTDFVKSMETAYKDYNRLKSEYIQSNYTRENDDVINQSSFYKKYDDYDYSVNKS